MTRDLVRRVHEHRTRASDGFTARYSIDRLVWFEVNQDALTAISRETEIKKWRREWKVALIERENPAWDDLYESIVG